MMTRLLVPALVGVLCAGSAAGQDARRSATEETRYLAFQIFTYSPNPKNAGMGEAKDTVAKFPERATLLDSINDIKARIGTVGDARTHLACTLGPLSFEHQDADVAQFIALGFQLALETDVAVAFHVDDSMFWKRRKDLWSDPKNVEALDWKGTPCTGRRLDWQTGPGAKPDAAPPQMCFNSPVIQREVRQRSTLVGKSIQAGVEQLRAAKRLELFAGVIVGWETMIGQDFKTGEYLGYRALLNRGFTRENPPPDLDREREKIVQEFIESWTGGVAAAGVDPRKLYSHTAFFSKRGFQMGGPAKLTYSQHNHFAPPSVAFGKHHRPGFSTYPQPGLFDDIYAELAQHQQVGWASSEGTNLQLGSGPGQSGMNMETYLAKIFHHGGTLVNLYSWGIGGEANKNMSFRVVTEGEEALAAYRKFLKGSPLVETKTEGLTLLERLPPKIHRIQKELPAWMEKTAPTDNEKARRAMALMQKLDAGMKAKDFAEVEKNADAVLKLLGIALPAAAPDAPEKESTVETRLPFKLARIEKELPEWIQKTGKAEQAAALMKKLDEQIKASNFEEAEKAADAVLMMIATGAPAAGDHVPEEVRGRLVHDLGSAFLVFRAQVQAELKVSKAQSEKLDAQLRRLLPEALRTLRTCENLQGEERERALKAYREPAREQLDALSKQVLDAGQQTRLRQLELQREGLFGWGEIWDELHVTRAQRMQFVEAIQQTRKRITPLLEAAQNGGNPAEIRPKVLKMRAELQDKLEALLTEAQMKQWKAMLGNPVALGVLFDLSSR